MDHILNIFGSIFIIIGFCCMSILAIIITCMFISDFIKGDL